MGFHIVLDDFTILRHMWQSSFISILPENSDLGQKMRVFGTALASRVGNEAPLAGALISSPGSTVPSTAAVWK